MRAQSCQVWKIDFETRSEWSNIHPLMFSFRDCKDLSSRYEIKVPDLNMEGASTSDRKMPYLVPHTQTSPRTSQPVLGSSKYRDNYSQVKKKKAFRLCCFSGWVWAETICFWETCYQKSYLILGLQDAKVSASAFYPNSWFFQSAELANE